jgi:arsenate reductase
MLKEMVEKAWLTMCRAIREDGTRCAEPGPDDPALTDDQLHDAMADHLVLISRPFVTHPKACRIQAVQVKGTPWL